MFIYKTTQNKNAISSYVFFFLRKNNQKQSRSTNEKYSAESSLFIREHPLTMM